MIRDFAVVRCAHLENEIEFIACAFIIVSGRAAACRRDLDSRNDLLLAEFGAGGDVWRAGAAHVESRTASASRPTRRRVGLLERESDELVSQTPVCRHIG